MSPRVQYHSESSPKVLEGNDLQSLAKYMKSDSCRNIFLMLGAGVSTSAGIPDFRSPGTGLYANLARLNLPYPEAVFEMDFFRRNPVPFYTLAKEIYPTRYRPTLTHSFIKLLHSHGLLHTCFTQNIDTLERRAGVPEGKIIEAHGSFASQKCIDCKDPYDDAKIEKAIINSEVPRCERCNGLVKPNIVFFGEALPKRFYEAACSLELKADANLLIVMGTSLTVHPFASMVDRVKGCPRVLINLDEVGNFHKQDDIVLLGKCDDIVRRLCRELGWEEELDREWEATADGAKAEDKPPAPGKNAEERISEELEQITKGIEESLLISEGVPESSPDCDKEETGTEKKDERHHDSLEKEELGAGLGKKIQEGQAASDGKL
ncbi:NAD-dependent deacetylase sirtuin-2 [Paxillus ammoniavirescens]|nr:NAD-dependent deacetylase sirtuin-2 [Paxillus ammoniavirescens]